MYQRIFHSRILFTVLGSFVGASAFLNAGFVSISVLIFFIFCLYNRAPNITDEVSTHKTLLLPVALFLAETLWLIFSDQPSEGLTALLIKKNSLLLLPVAFLLFGQKISHRQVNVILVLFVIAFFVTSLICYGHALYRVLENRSFSEVNMDRKYYYFSYLYLTQPSNSTPIYLGLFSNFAFIAVLYKFSFSLALRIALLVYIGVFIILVASKIAMISLVLTILVFVLFKQRSWFKSSVLFVSLVLVIAAAIYLFPFLRERFLTPVILDYKQPYASAWNSTSLRLAIWNCSTEAIKRNPLVGYGTGDGQRALEVIYREKGFVRGVEDGFNAHNQFMLTMLDLGIVGFLILFIMLAYPFLEAIKSRDMLTISFLIIIFLVFCIEGLFARQKGIAFFSFFYSLLVRHRKTQV